MSDTSTDSVKQRMQAALTAAMRARDEVSMSSLRQALAEVAVAETAGAELVVLSDDAVLAVLIRLNRARYTQKNKLLKRR